MIFAKPPIAGVAKTRLMPRLGAVGAAALHQKLVLRTLDNVHRPEQWDTNLWCAGDVTHPFFQACALDYRLSLYPQSEADLGQRMYAALQSSLRVYEAVCLLGTDCPLLSEAHIRQAFEQLDQGHDLVFSPAEDGGYVLIAAKFIKRELFENIQWGSCTVMQQSLANAEQLSLQVSLLPTLWDVDVPEDLPRLASLNLGPANK